MVGGLTAKDNSAPPDRESIWSISPGWRTVYFVLFVIQNIAGISLLCWYEIFLRTGDDAIQTILNISHGSGQTAIGSAGITLTITEAGRLIMVLGEQLQRWFEKREDARVTRRVDEAVAQAVDEAVAQAVDEVVAQAVDEGRGEAHRQWSEWIQRKMEAEAKGELFEEPPPNSNSNGADGA